MSRPPNLDDDACARSLALNQPRRQFGLRTDCSPALDRMATTAEQSAGWRNLADSEERRASPRLRTLLSGKLVIDDGARSPDCVIRNLSSDGALVLVGMEAHLPTRLGLLMPRDGVLIELRRVWRQDSRMGVAFGHRHDLNAPTTPQLKRARALWLELAGR